MYFDIALLSCNLSHLPGSVIARLRCEQHSNQQQLRPTVKLIKYGLQPDECENLVRSKTKSLFAVQHVDVNEEMKKLMEDSITSLKREVCLRVNEDKTKLDQRRKSTINYEEEGKSPDKITPPHIADKSRRGEIKPSKRHCSEYHAEQHDLFDYLGKRRRYDGAISSENGYLYRNGHQLTPDQFFDIVDKITSDYICELKIADTDSEEWMTVFNHSIEIVMLRQVANMAKESDLMSRSGWNQWRVHALAITSFASLAVVLDMLAVQFGGSSFFAHRFPKRSRHMKEGKD